MYIGETSRTLEKRLSEHKNAVKTHDIYLQWDCSPCLDQPTPSGLEGHQDKRNGRELLEEKGTGNSKHSHHLIF